MAIDDVDEEGSDEEDRTRDDEQEREVEARETVTGELVEGADRSDSVSSAERKDKVLPSESEDGAVTATSAEVDVTVEREDLRAYLAAAAVVGEQIDHETDELVNGRAQVVKDEYTWAHFKWEYYYDEVGNPPTGNDGKVKPFDPSEYLDFEPDLLSKTLEHADSSAVKLESIVDERTVNVLPDLDEDKFFSNTEGFTTISNRYDLEKTVPLEKKRHFIEEERYWVNKPFAFIVIFHSQKENEKKYYLVEPYLNQVEKELEEFLTAKLRTAIKYTEEGIVIEGSNEERREVIERETNRLLNRYNLYDGPGHGGRGFVAGLVESMNLTNGDSYLGQIEGFLERRGWYEPQEPFEDREIQGLSARPEPVVIAEDKPELSEYQVEKLRYVLVRDFIGYERIDGIKHDINVEDISVDGYDSPVFVYHTDYEQLITNVHHGTQQLDDFVVKMAQRAGKGISKRQPQVDATLPDGSRAQLTLGKEVSDHGTNYTIRQFKDVPFTPVDLINWKTFSLEQMAFLWLCIENNKSLLFAGGTASGKTTSLNAVSLFIPSNAKIVSIEDTREVELPQRNWVASVTRPSFGEDETGDIDEFDLLEAALRQRPDYIIMGEVRGEEGRTLFQVMSTGHTTYTTFHADNVSEVIKRFTTDPINVSKTLFTALDLISIQSSTRVQGKKVRRSRSLTEIRRYDPENDEINVNDVFQWRPESDTYRSTAESTTLDEIKFDRGWSDAELNRNLFERRVILAYLITNGLNSYTEVAATIQAYINDPETILTLVANDQLIDALEDLREMESVLIEVDPEKEEMVPRPEPGQDELENAESILEKAEKELFPKYKGKEAPDISQILTESHTEKIVVTDAESSRKGPTLERDTAEDVQDGTATAAEDYDPAGTEQALESEADTTAAMGDEARAIDDSSGTDEVELKDDAEGADTQEMEDHHDFDPGETGQPRADQLEDESIFISASHDEEDEKEEEEEGQE